MEYWAIVNGTKVGPLSIEALGTYDITSDTMVWHRGLSQWIPARNVPELQHILRPSYAPGQPVYSAPRPANPYGANAPICPPNYLAWSIVATLLCCQVTGIIAIIYSSLVDSRYRRGDYAGAVSASGTAKGWVIASAIIGALGIIFYILLMVFGVFGSFLSTL